MHTDDSEPSLEGSFRDSLTAGSRPVLGVPLRAP